MIVSNDFGQLFRVNQICSKLIANGTESMKHIQAGFFIDEETE